MATSKFDISIIILSYNTKELLVKCLESVKAADKESINVQVLVVDNASSDNSYEMVKKDFSWVEAVRSEENLGYSGGNNLGLKHSQAKYILFLNSDTEIYKESLLEMKKFMESDSKIGAVTPKTILFSGGMDPDCHRGFPTPWASLTYFLGLESIFPKSKLFGQYHKLYLDINTNHEIDAGFGTFMFVRQQALSEVGGWDETYFFYGEDLDLFFRIKEKGWKVMFYSKPLLLHHKGGSSGLRKESQDVVKVDKATRIKVAKSSIKAMEIFYAKFYKSKYNPLITMIVLAGIRVKGFFRILLHSLT